MSGGEQVVDVDQEALLDDVGVGQQESDFGPFAARLGIQSQQICLELVDAIGGVCTDLEDLVPWEASIRISLECASDIFALSREQSDSARLCLCRYNMGRWQLQDPPSQGLLATATNSNQHHISARYGDHPGNPADMLYCLQ